ncbi:MAG TPA: GNAT family N-acetyltransferase [Methylococcaceae bacterium]|nr:GNAT family N-acetyltransferase [Methylococcaceae bacterium]
MNTPPTPVVVRPAKAGDLEALSGLLQVLFALERDFAFDADKARRGLSLLLDRDDALLLAAEAEGDVVGMCSVQTLISTAEGGPVGMVEDLVVAESWRGRGIGRLLLNELENWAASRGLTRLQLLADASNLPTLDFYTRLGWSEMHLVVRRKLLG